MEQTVNQRIELLTSHFERGIKSAFARQIGVSQQALQHLLAGRGGEPSLKVLSGILAAYPPVSAEWLLRGRGPMLLDNGLRDISAVPTPSTADDSDGPQRPKSILPEAIANAQRDEVAQLRDQLFALSKQVDFLLRRVAELS